ncbi:DUF2949 domain-containing protein [Synechococcales cyanobacterium C]|uniref:DUF2949 domain-containing protein n=2 Tax=Petrachloros TaxID=2918834 RepID=A0A8K2A176_9CYAN|nr:DUF2949 domain-containing protein [Petrachloros mirabilis ULC683]
MQPTRLSRLITFLEKELALPDAAIRLATKQGESRCHALPVVLWQYGLVNLKQLNQIFAWLETV